MTVWNLRLNNVNIALVNYVIKQLKSIYLYPSVLVVGLYQTRYYLIPSSNEMTLFIYLLIKRQGE